jgi:hypothetical protein
VGPVGRILVSGGAAAVASAIAAAVCSRVERGRATPPLNAVSHIAWGGAPPADAGPAGVNLATGLALHAGASFFWATPFEALFGRAARRGAAAAWLGGTLVSAAAFATDYYLVSRRFRPGYEAYLSPRALFAVYAALAAGLAIGARSARLNHHEPKDRHERGERRHAERGPGRVIAPEAGREVAAGGRRRAGDRGHADLQRQDRNPARRRQDIERDRRP